MKNESDPEKDLINLISEVSQKAHEISDKGSFAVEFGHEVIDLANESNNLFKYGLPSNIDINTQFRAWRYLYQQEDRMLESLIPISTDSTAASVTASYAMLDYTDPDKIIDFYPPDKHEGVKLAAYHLGQVINKKADKQKVLDLLNEYNFAASTSNIKSPYELFETSWAAFEKSVNENVPASTSLIPMRESINSAIDLLIKLRPFQERASGEMNKIFSILNQLHGNAVTEDAIQSLAERWTHLSNELSGSKQKNFDKREWTDCQRRSTIFFLEFLQSIDKSKLKH